VLLQRRKANYLEATLLITILFRVGVKTNMTVSTVKNKSGAVSCRINLGTVYG